MRRIVKSRCTPPSTLPAEIGGGYSQTIGRRLSILLSEQAHKGGKVTYIDHCVNLYWFVLRPILVHASTYIASPSDQYRS